MFEDDLYRSNLVQRCF